MNPPTPGLDPSRLPVLDDPRLPELAPFMGLRDHAGRQRREARGGDMAGWFLAEGDLVIERAVAAGHSVSSVLVDARRTAPLPGVGETTMVLRAAPAVLEAVCGRPKLRDPIAQCVRPSAHSIEAVVAGARTVAVLEGIVNPTNMGVIARCGAGLGIEALVLDSSCCDPLYRRAVRVSMGEIFSIAHARIGGDGTIGTGLAALGRLGFTTLALTPSPTADDIGSIERTSGDRVAIVLGTEGSGLSEDALAGADRRVRIPMAAGVDSINVGTAAAVAFYALGVA